MYTKEVIRGIIFDCFGVLYMGSLNYLRELTPPDKLQELNNLSISSDYGYVSKDEYFQYVGRLIGHTGSEVENLVASKHARNEPLLSLLRSLKTDYKIGLLSNVGQDIIESLFRAEEQALLFDTVVLSSQVGMAKPSREIYELTAQRLGLAPEECLMIDDIDANVDGARLSGMRGITYTSVEQLKGELIKEGVIHSFSTSS